MRFTLRDLLWLTAVVALGVGWWVDRSRLAKELDLLEKQFWGDLPGSIMDLGMAVRDPLAPAPNLPSD